MMVDNSTNINKANNYLNRQIIDQKKKTIHKPMETEVLACDKQEYNEIFFFFFFCRK